MSLGPWEIGAVLVVVLIIFGPKKLPALGKSCADFIKNLKSGVREVEKETHEIRDQLKP